MVTFEEIGGEDALWDTSSNFVTEEDHGDGRWMKYMTTVLKHEGKFYEVDWQRGLTEYQEDYYPDNNEELKEVFAQDIVTVTPTRVYVEELLEDEPVLLESTIESLEKLVSLSAVEEEIEVLKNIDSGAIIAALEGLEVLRVDQKFDAYVQSVIKFFEEFAD